MDSTIDKPIFTENFLKDEVARLKLDLNSARTQLAKYQFPAEKITQDDIRAEFVNVRNCTEILLGNLSTDCGYLIADNYEYSNEDRRVMDATLNSLAEKIGDLYRVLKGYQFFNEYKVTGTMDFSTIIVARSEKEAEELAREDIHASGRDYGDNTETDDISIDSVDYLCKSNDEC